MKTSHLFFAFFVLFVANLAWCQTAKTRANLYTEVNTLFADTGATEITPADVRTALKNVVASSYNSLTDGAPASAPAWGTITGTLSAQTDLQAALNAKQAAGSYQPLATVLTNTTAAFTAAQETKLSGIASGATANSADATLLARANHTGTQSVSTITGLGTLATQNGTFSGTSSGTNTGDQDLSGYATSSALSSQLSALSSVYQPLATVLTNTTASYTSAINTRLANTSGTNTGDQDLSGYVPTTRTVNGAALSSNIVITTITGNAGTATALQTARAINGVNFDGTAAITVAAAGSTLTDTVPVEKGGTSATTLASNAVLLGNGTSALQTVAPGTNGNVLTSNGTTWTSAAPSGGGGSGQLVIPLGNPSGLFTNLPATVGFWAGSTGHQFGVRVDLTNYTQVRFVANKQAVAGAAGSKITLRYNSTFSTTASAYSDIGTSAVELAVDVGTSMLATSWINLAAGAKADVVCMPLGYGGDGVTDPSFGALSAQFK